MEPAITMLEKHCLFMIQMHAAILLGPDVHIPRYNLDTRAQISIMLGDWIPQIQLLLLLLHWENVYPLPPLPPTLPNYKENSSETIKYNGIEFGAVGF